MNQTVSVVLPAYNGDLFIAAAIDSALAQTIIPFEIIVVDDGSNDATESIVRSYGDRVSYIRQQNKGTSGAYNTGIAAASGDYIAFLEQDDIWSPDKNSAQLAAFYGNDDLGMVFSPVCILKEELASKRSDIDEQSEEGEYSFEDFFVRNRVLNCSTVMIRRDVLKHVGGFREDLKLAFDYDLWLRIAAEFRVLCLSTPLATYRIHGNNQSKDDHDLLAAECSLGILQSLVDKPGLPEKVGRAVVRERISRLHREVAWEHARLGHRDEELQHLFATARVSPFKLSNWREYLWRRIDRQTRNRMVWYLQRIQRALGRATTPGARK
jgi:glycosyltransferase involved in cell wall biosynthesis